MNSGFSHNAQTRNNPSVLQQMNGQTVVHPYNGILFGMCAKLLQWCLILRVGHNLATEK